MCVKACFQGCAHCKLVKKIKGRGAVDHYHSLPNKDSDSSVVKSRKDAFWTYLHRANESVMQNSVHLLFSALYKVCFQVQVVSAVKC